MTSALLLAALPALFALPAEAATLTVCPSDGQYATIQAAVDAAGPGDVIEICAGAYLENVDLAAMGSAGGGQGDITLRGVGATVIAPLTGSALALSAPFTGDILLENLSVTSPDDNAIFFGRAIYGSLTVSGSSIVNAGGAGLLAFAVSEGATISGTALAGNGGAGAFVATQLAGGGCPAPGLVRESAAASAGVTAITVTASTAEGNSGRGFLLESAYGDILVRDSRAANNGDDGFYLAVTDACTGSTVFVDGSRAEDNGGGFTGSGFLIAAPNARVVDTAAAGNTFDGIEQDFGDPKLLDSVWALEVMSSTAGGNGRYGVRTGSVDFVTVTAVSAISNGVTGILIPFTPLFGPEGSGDQAAAAKFDQHAAVADSLVMSNGVGIELFYEEVRGAEQGAAAASVVGSDISGNIICANANAGVFAWGGGAPTYGAAANYWGSFTGPYHAAKNPSGLGNAVVDATSGSDGVGNVLFAPWVDAGVIEIAPLIGIPGAQQAVTVTFPAGGGPGLRRGPGDPNAGPLWTVATDNGVVATSYGAGPTASAAIDAVSGAITATLTPAASGVATVTVSGPCGLYAARSAPVAAPSLAIAKNPPQQTVLSGETAEFQIAVTNTGDITLTQAVVSDPSVPACGRSLDDLPPGGSAAYACRQPGVVISYTNQITVTANPLIEAPPASRGALAPAVAPQDVVVTATAAAAVIVTQPTGLEPGPEPGLERLHLPFVRR